MLLALFSNKKAFSKGPCLSLLVSDFLHFSPLAPDFGLDLKPFRFEVRNQDLYLFTYQFDEMNRF